MREIAFTDALGRTTWQAIARTGPAEYAGGTAYYLGDFSVRATEAFTSKVLYFGVALNWLLENGEDNFAATTADLKAAYRGFATYPTQNRSLAKSRRQEVAGDASMPPERVARIAPVTRRNFATLAECAPACGQGKCLPYRGADGHPAITCIAQCKVDGDCPEGLACNCSEASPDCTPIATTDQDPMAGICLSVEAHGQRR